MRWFGQRKDAPAADDARNDELCCRYFDSPEGIVDLENCSEWRLVAVYRWQPNGLVAFFRRRRRG